MDKKELVEVLAALSRAPGVSGYEEEAVAEASRFFAPYVTGVEQDRLGNLVALKEGSPVCERGVEGDLKAEKISLLLAAHVDEIGLMVTKIEDKGFLRFTSMGGVDPRTLPGQEVAVHGREKLRGVIGARPPHLLTQSERQKELELADMFIDLGRKEEDVRRHVRVGDVVTLDRDPLLLAGGAGVAGKAMDNRAGVAALVLCAAELAAVQHAADVYFVATVQEEVGLRGAITAAYGLVPDLAVAVDVTHGKAPGLRDESFSQLGAGPAVAVGPNIHPVLGRRLQELSAEYRIPCQVEPVASSSFTDAWALQVSREGIPSAVLSVPLRYMHSAVETLHVDDLLWTGRLLAYLARSADRALVEVMSCI